MGILVAIASSRSEVERGDGNRINGNVKYIYFNIYNPEPSESGQAHPISNGRVTKSGSIVVFPQGLTLDCGLGGSDLN